jgi:transcriptional regulator with XRE-family HTH domain
MDAGELLTRSRRAAGLSQAEVAERAGTSQPVISAYERGHREPTVPTLRRLLAAAGVRLELGARPVPASDLPPPADDHEHAARLLDVLSLAHAVPLRPRGELKAPIMRSGVRR